MDLLLIPDMYITVEAEAEAEVEVEVEVESQRRGVRKSVCWSIEGQWRDGSKFTGKTMNVSESGIMMTLASSPRMNQRAYIKVRVNLPHEIKWIDAIIDVKHQSLSSNKYNVGAIFVKISDKSKELIRDLRCNKPILKKIASVY
jgi:hypothetical protein